MPCHKAGGQAGIALSDPFCVDRHRADFRRLVAGPMDYVIGNIHEWKSLYQVEDLEEALRLASADLRHRGLHLLGRGCDPDPRRRAGDPRLCTASCRSMPPARAISSPPG